MEEQGKIDIGVVRQLGKTSKGINEREETLTPASKMVELGRLY